MPRTRLSSTNSTTPLLLSTSSTGSALCQLDTVIDDRDDVAENDKNFLTTVEETKMAPSTETDSEENDDDDDVVTDYSITSRKREMVESGTTTEISDTGIENGVRMSENRHFSDAEPDCSFTESLSVYNEDRARNSVNDDSNQVSDSVYVSISEAGESAPYEKVTRPQPKAYSREEVLRFTEYDCLVNGFQQVAIDNNNLYEKYNSLRKQCYILTAVSVIVAISMLLFVISIVLYSSLKNDGNGYITKDYVNNRLSELSDNLEQSRKICLQCTILTDLIGPVNFVVDLDEEDPSKCCFKDSSVLLESLIQKLDNVVPVVDNVLRLLEGNISALRGNDPGSSGAVIDPSQLQRLRQNGQAKGAIHLQGRFNNRVRQMKWENKAAASSVTLTSDSTKVVIGNKGNYFIYARVRYKQNRQKSSTSFQYQIYQKNARGHVSSLEDVWSTLESDQVNKTSSVHRVAEFNAGDQVYIHLSTQYLPLVSLEDDHEFGMFEI